MDDKLNYFIGRTDRTLDQIWKKLSDIEKKLEDKHDVLNDKITHLENFKSRVMGIAIGVSLLANGVWQVFSKLL